MTLELCCSWRDSLHGAGWAGTLVASASGGSPACMLHTLQTALCCEMPQLAAVGFHHDDLAQHQGLLKLAQASQAGNGCPPCSLHSPQVIQHLVIKLGLLPQVGQPQQAVQLLLHDSFHTLRHLSGLHKGGRGAGGGAQSAAGECA